MNKINIYNSFSPDVIKVGEKLLNVIIEHDQFRKIREAALDMVHTMRHLRKPSGIVVQADPGMGKTLLLEVIRKELQDAAVKREESCLHIALDSAVDTRAMAESVMLALGYPARPTRANLIAMNHMIQVGLEQRKPWVLTVDEMQHVCEGNRDITAKAVTDWLKVRMDLHNLPIICAGTQVLERLYLINPQFTSRASASFILSPFALDEAWRQLLAGFSEYMSSSVDLSIINTSMVRRMHMATQGNMRMLKNILMHACMRAYIQEKRVVTREILALSYFDVKGQSVGGGNPFQV